MLTTTSSSITFNWPNTPEVAELPRDAYCVLANRSIYTLMKEQHSKNKLYYFAVAIDGTTKPFFADGSYFARYLVVYGKNESPLTRKSFQKGAFFEVRAPSLEAKFLCTFQEFNSNYNGVQHFIAASDDDLESKQRIESARAVAQRTLMQNASVSNLDTIYWMCQAAEQKDIYCSSWLGQHYLTSEPEKAVDYFESVLANTDSPPELYNLIIQLMPKALKRHPNPYSHTHEFLKNFWSSLKPEDLIKLQSIIEKHETRKQSNSFLNLPDIPLTEDLLISHSHESPDSDSSTSNLGELIFTNDFIEKR